MKCSPVRVEIGAIDDADGGGIGVFVERGVVIVDAMTRHGYEAYLGELTPQRATELASLLLKAALLAAEYGLD